MRSGFRYAGASDSGRPLQLVHPALLQPVPDYYVDPSRPDDTGDGLTVATAKQTIPAGMALMTGQTGKILQLRKGIYTGSSQLITESDLDAASGAAGAYNKVVAQEPRGVVIEETFGDTGAVTGTSAYVEFHGIKWKTPSLVAASASRKAFRRQHVKMFQCSFSGGRLAENEVQFAVGDDLQLYEDCWFYGYGGRAIISVFQKRQVILRRCVIRCDSAWGWLGGSSEPLSIGTFYPNGLDGSVDLILQNCIFIGSWHNTPPAAQGTFGFTVTNNDSAGGEVPTNIIMQGCIWADNKTSDMEWGGSATLGYVELTDSAFLDGDASGLILSPGAFDADPNPLIKQCLFHNKANNGIVHNNAAGNNHVDADQCILQDMPTAISNATFIIGDYNNCWNNTTGNCGTNEITTDPMVNGLQHPTRIENGGSLLTAGPAGDRVGPEILFQRGTTGTLHGDVGWDALTDVPLWPFPNEGLIRLDFLEITPAVQVTLAAGGFVSFVAGDRGKQLTDDGSDVGEIIDFNNTDRLVLIKSNDYSVPSIADSSTIAVNGGTGGGTSSGASAQATEAGNRQFCQSGNDAYGRPHTLSRYIWQKLGVEVPDEYGLRD